jgi:hypothetical protein
LQPPRQGPVQCVGADEPGSPAAFVLGETRLDAGYVAVLALARQGIDTEKGSDPRRYVHDSIIREGPVGQKDGAQHPAAPGHESLQPLHRLQLEMRHRRQDQQLVAFVANLDHAVRDLGAVQDLLVEVVEIVMEAQQEIGQRVEVELGSVAERVALLRGVEGEDRARRPEDRHLGNMPTSREEMAQPGNVAGELVVDVPPGVLVEHRRRPVPLARTFQGVVETMRVEQVDAQDVLPVGDPLHPLHRGVHEDAAERLAEESLAAQLMGGRGGELQGDVLGRPVAAADDRVEVIDTDHIQMWVMTEWVPFDAHHLAQPLLEKEMTGEEYVVLAAPIVDLPVVGVRVESGQRLVEVVADTGALGTDVEEEVRQARPQIVSIALVEAPEHLLCPGHDRVVAPGHVVVHRRLIGVEAGHRERHLVAERLRVRLVAEAQEFGGRLRVEGVDVVVGALLHQVHDPPVAGRDFLGDDVLEREIRGEIDDAAVFSETEGGHGC